MSMHGPRNNKFFRMVAINARQRRDARPIELLGEYRPQVSTQANHPVKTMQWSVDRIKYWLGVGAIPSKSAVRLLVQVCTVFHPSQVLILSTIVHYRVESYRQTLSLTTPHHERNPTYDKKKMHHKRNHKARRSVSDKIPIVSCLDRWSHIALYPSPRWKTVYISQVAYDDIN